MLLAIDVGNTQTVVGLFNGADLSDHWRIATDANRTSDELALMIQSSLGRLLDARSPACHVIGRRACRAAVLTSGTSRCHARRRTRRAHGHADPL
jgi:pantothenate kinase type III